MTQYNLWQVDAFTDQVFKGNPAAVMVLDDWFADDVMLAIAAENNLAETAFVINRGAGQYDLRWFTPGTEVPLCGHATLAAAHTLWTECDERAEQLVFATQSGPLRVTRDGAAGYVMDFPADPPIPFDVPAGLAAALGAPIKEMWAGQYLLAVLESETAVRNLKPDMMALDAFRLPRGRGAAVDLTVTAPGENGLDFVSRFFGPTVGITEDPVTGSAHCMLAPYWSERLGKTALKAYQASARGGYVDCTVVGDRVVLRGAAVTYLRGAITL